MNEIVGESGTQTGKGCLMALVKPVAVLALMTGAILTGGTAQADLAPRKPTCLPVGVPNVVGMWTPDAGDVLAEAGFRYHVNLVKGEVDLFHVESTLPTAGTLASPCSTVVEIWRGR